ncbi:rho guanine nucleotide exchange factor 10-like protein [Nephila pilipes]|uniref:Rho guanine nucleotide exchange factor 10-like protein n=1 Tax=Nephila pilipes TaxID=299642 RepID=A0A8X6UW66_NEPPI|nr:rho guanine nucleotide exchange factor 10-like protein [Nephila pilipes]
MEQSVRGGLIQRNCHEAKYAKVNHTMKEGSEEEFECPVAIEFYNKIMGVNLANQLANVYELDRKSRKWWEKLRLPDITTGRGPPIRRRYIDPHKPQIYPQNPIHPTRLHIEKLNHYHQNFLHNLSSVFGDKLEIRIFEDNHEVELDVLYKLILMKK